MIICYERATGRITQTVQAPDHYAVHFQQWPVIDVLVLPDDSSISDATYYVADGVLVPFPARPSAFHSWDWTTKAWVGDSGAARAKRRTDVDVERGRRSVLPITFAGSPFDADKTARERITGTISRIVRGDGLPVGWVGWRDADNAMHWGALDAASVLAELRGLSSAIENREQALLVASWTHKANIAALTDIDSIIAYDVTAGWPT